MASRAVLRHDRSLLPGGGRGLGVRRGTSVAEREDIRKPRRGRIVLAEFGYGGKLLPTFPKWVIDGTRPSRLAWLLKERIPPLVFWQGMLKGREWLAAPQVNSPVS
jgi:hypothetical protein